LRVESDRRLLASARELRPLTLGVSWQSLKGGGVIEIHFVNGVRGRLRNEDPLHLRSACYLARSAAYAGIAAVSYNRVAPSEVALLF
jgi:hypothetical protein